MEPYVIYHMVASIDGRIRVSDGAPFQNHPEIIAPIDIVKVCFFSSSVLESAQRGVTPKGEGYESSEADRHGDCHSHLLHAELCARAKRMQRSANGPR
jgi:hypothetical protein